MLRPTARLRFEIDCDELNDELVGDLKNCFLNVAPLKVMERPEIKDGQPARNILGLMVVLNESYFTPATEQSNALWEEVLMPWLEKKLYKLNATVQSYNRTRSAAGQPVHFGQFELILGPHVIAVQLDSDSALPKALPELAENVRACANAGCFGDCSDFLRVEIARYSEDRDDSDEGQQEDEGPQTIAGNAEASEPLSEFSKIWKVRAIDGSAERFDSEERAWLHE